VQLFFILFYKRNKDKEIKLIFTKMSISADEIEAIVANILELKEMVSRKELDNRFLDFRTKNRIFYETLLNGQFQPEIFKEMMKRKRELESGKDQYSVDVKFGEYMAEKYLAPALKNIKSNQTS
jgi:hypothetical protein